MTATHPAGAGPPGQGLLEAVVEQGPVGQAGQRIVHGLVADGVLGPEPHGGGEDDAGHGLDELLVARARRGASW